MKIKMELTLTPYINSLAKAKKIRIVQDNLNTHNASSFYEQFSAEKAFDLAQRFEFFYTHKSGS